MQFQHKLHIVYLVNDILHHCRRKGAQDLQKTLEDIIVPLFFCTQTGESPENLQKLTKVLGIWENHNLFEPPLLEVSKKYVWWSCVKFIRLIHLKTHSILEKPCWNMSQLSLKFTLRKKNPVHKDVQYVQFNCTRYYKTTSYNITLQLSYLLQKVAGNKHSPTCQGECQNLLGKKKS